MCRFPEFVPFQNPIPMNISRFLVGALVVCALPALAQPEQKPVNGLPFPLVTPEEAGKLAFAEKPIALHLRDVTLGEALEELSKQSGVALDTSWGGDPEILGKKLSLDLETRSFNEAFNAILDEADVKAVLRQMGGRGTWNVMFNQPDEQNDVMQSGTGLFQLRVLSLNSSLSKSVTPGNKGAAKRSQNTNLSVSFGMLPNPQVAVVGAPLLRITRAEDEKGRSLSDDRHNFLGFGNRGEHSSVQLRPLEDASQKLAHLDGVAVYVIPIKRERWEVDDVLNAKDLSHDFQSGGQKLTLTIQRAQKNGDSVSLDLKLSRPNGEGRDPSFSFEQLTSAVQLMDAKGQKLVAGGYSGTGGGNALTAQASFGLAPPRRPPFILQDGKRVPAPPPEKLVLTEPIKLVFDFPTEFVQTEVPFSFSDVPLP